MKSDKFRELYSRIDTDISMDHRIKNRLLYYDHLKEADDRNRFGERYEGSSHNSAKIRRLKPLLPSLAIIIFVMIILIGIRANLFSKTPEQETAASNSQNSEDSGLTSILDRLFGEEAEQNSEITQNDKNQSEISEEAIILEDNTQPVNGSEGTDGQTEGSLNEFTKGSDGKSENPMEKIPEASQEGAQNSDTKTVKAVVPAAGDFYFAYFDVLTAGSVKASIPSLVIRLHGTVDSINPADLTEIVLTRDGVQVDNNLNYTGKMEQFIKFNEECTDFYFLFTKENLEPGTYDLKGKYKGISFDVYNKIIETAVTEEPAAGEKLTSVGWVYKPDKNDEPMIISELTFHFVGLQNTFYVTDLTELKATVNGNEIPIAFDERIFRYYEANDYNTGDTSFNLVIKDPFTASGTYVVTGNYRGVPFTSMELTIP